jgi:CBS domain-containing protein
MKQAHSRFDQRHQGNSMKAQEVMTRSVITAKKDLPLQEAIALMLANGISGLPVVDESGAPIGMLTEGDLLRRSEIGTERHRPRWLEFLRGPGLQAREYTHLHGRKVGDVMTEEPKFVDSDASLEQVVELMERHHIKRVPVVRDGRLVGIISRANLLRALLLATQSLPAATSSDDEIRERLWRELEATSWAPCALLNIVVRDGTVHLHGTIFDERERAALKVAAENIPGVKGVQDHLAWCEPMSGIVVQGPADEEDTAR